MSVSLFFGLPGAGKTTILAYFALKGVKDKKYKNVYSNVDLNIFGVTKIDNDCIGKYYLSDGLLLIDEATLFADSRAYKSFDVGKLTYFLEHRHYNVDIILFTQQWDGVDRKIRVITDRVYYVYKGVFLGRWFTRYYRIPYGIIIPDPKKDTSEKLGDIVQGYCKPHFLIRLFSPWLFRPKYYKYFDSWECPPLPALPLRYQPYSVKALSGTRVYSQKMLRKENKRFILLRLVSAPKRFWGMLQEDFSPSSPLMSRYVLPAWNRIRSFFASIVRGVSSFYSVKEEQSDDE